jgi:hypothetical protein
VAHGRLSPHHTSVGTNQNGTGSGASSMSFGICLVWFLLP